MLFRAWFVGLWRRNKFQHRRMTQIHQGHPHPQRLNYGRPGTLTTFGKWAHDFGKIFHNWIWNSRVSFCLLLSWKDNPNRSMKPDHPIPEAVFNHPNSIAKSILNLVSTDEFQNVYGLVCVVGRALHVYGVIECMCSFHPSGTCKSTLLSLPPTHYRESAMWA